MLLSKIHHVAVSVTSVLRRGHDQLVTLGKRL
jgi:hypothetical protein